MFTMPKSLVDKIDSQAHKLTFTLNQSHKDKLIINALSENILYQAQLQTHPLIDFEEVKQKLTTKQYKIISSSPELIQIKAGALKLDFSNVQKLGLEILKQKINELTIKSKEQSEKNVALEGEIKKMKNEFDLIVSKMTDLAKKYDQSQDQVSELKKELKSLKTKSEEQTTKTNQLSKTSIKHESQISLIKKQFVEHKDILKIHQELMMSNEWQNRENQNKINESKEKVKIVEEFKKEVYSKFLTKEEGMKQNLELTQLIEHKNEERQNIQKSLEFLINSLDEKVHQIVNNPQKLSTKSLLSRRFSPQQKSNQIRLKDNNSKATNENLSLFNALMGMGFPLALTQGSVQQKGSSIKLKVNKMNQCVGVGLVISSMVANNSYVLVNRQTGHGCFFLLWNGRSFCHSHKEFNDVQKGFEFAEGDVLSVETNVEELVFVNESKKKTFKLKIKLVDKQWSQARFCVVVRGAGDEVEIIE